MFTLDNAKKMIHGQKCFRWLDKMVNKWGLELFCCDV